MFFKRKKVEVPSGTQEVEAVELWEVRWESRCGKWHTDTRPEVEVFTSPEDAHKFAQALRDAFKLVRNTAPENHVTVYKRK